MRLALFIIAVFVLAMFILHGTVGVLGAPTTPGPWSNDCLGWAQMLGKEGRVHDSISMHLLGCDDDRYGAANAHYHATISGDRSDYCTSLARRWARAGWFSLPWTIARKVQAQLPFCTVFEDGSYSALG